MDVERAGDEVALRVTTDPDDPVAAAVLRRAGASVMVTLLLLPYPSRRGHDSRRGDAHRPRRRPAHPHRRPPVRPSAHPAPATAEAPKEALP